MTLSTGLFTVVQAVNVSGPVVAPAAGSVTFVPNLNVVNSEPLDQTIYIQAVTGLLTPSGLKTSGGAAVQLLDNVNLGLVPGELMYTVLYSISGEEDTPSFKIMAPGTGATVDLNDPDVQLPADL